MRDDTILRARLVAREGTAFMAAWHQLWDDPEVLSFTKMRPPASFDVIFATAQPDDFVPPDR